jgi:hypothetical protein
VYLIPLSVTALAALAGLGVAVWGIRRLSREHRDMRKSLYHGQ